MSSSRRENDSGILCTYIYSDTLKIIVYLQICNVRETSNQRCKMTKPKSNNSIICFSNRIK